jgi:hypothetical protein
VVAAAIVGAVSVEFFLTCLGILLYYTTANSF